MSRCGMNFLHFHKHIFAKLSPAQSNSNSVGWAEIALIPTFTHPLPPPPGKVPSSAQPSSIQLQLEANLSS